MFIKEHKAVLLSFDVDIKPYMVDGLKANRRPFQKFYVSIDRGINSSYTVSGKGLQKYRLIDF